MSLCTMFFVKERKRDIFELTVLLRGNKNLHSGSIVISIDDGHARMELTQLLQFLDEKLVVVPCKLIQPFNATCLWLVIFFLVSLECQQILWEAPNREIPWSN